MNILRIDSRSDDVASKIAFLREKLSPRGDIVSESGRAKTIETFGEPLTPVQSVEKICRDVENNGLSALLYYSKKFDGADLTAETLRVPLVEIKEASKKVDAAFLTAVRNIRKRIETFQNAILQKDVRIECQDGYLSERYRPLRRIGICVPGGAAAYPSTVLMTAVPAMVAGVQEIAVMVPPTKFGAYNTDMLAVCNELGITEVYRMGGAQGVAALAYGIVSSRNRPLIERVDKIVGPGNLFVALAKRFVFGEVDIDSIAGPSEVVVIIDASTNPLYTAYDILAQAEHSPGASILIGWDENAVSASIAAIEEHIKKVERGQLALRSLEDFGAVILVRNPEEACRITNEIAPEHLHIATANAEELADKISCAGAIFLGNYTPVAVGDYAAGPSHVLPTSGTARFASGLTCNDFLRANSILSFGKEGLKELASDIDIIATKEGLTAHRGSVRKRLN